MAEKAYEDGYERGVEYANYHFGMWQDQEGPPFPWPRVASEVRGFIEECVPIMMQVFWAMAKEDAIRAGVSPENLPYIYMPREFLSDIEDGYRARLTELLNEFLRRRSMRGY